MDSPRQFLVHGEEHRAVGGRQMQQRKRRRESQHRFHAQSEFVRLREVAELGPAGIGRDGSDKNLLGRPASQHDDEFVCQARLGRLVIIVGNPRDAAAALPGGVQRDQLEGAGIELNPCHGMPGLVDREPVEELVRRQRASPQ